MAPSPPHRDSPSLRGHGIQASLAGQSAIVTGGAGALGRHVVAELLKGGDSVHVPLHRQEQDEELRDFLCRQTGLTREALQALLYTAAADMTREEAVETFVRHAAAVGPPPTILAAILGGFRMAPLEETSLSDWEAMWKLNATSAFLACRAVVPGMKAAGWGRIVLVGAMPATTGGVGNMTAYGASKAAVVNLTGALAEELRPHGIAVNAVVPTILDTPANRAAMPDASPKEWLAPEDLAEVVGFLTSSTAGILSGAVIPLAGLPSKGVDRT